MTKHARFGHLRVIVFTITLASLLIGLVIPGRAFLNTPALAYGNAASPSSTALPQSSTTVCSVTVNVPGTSNPWLAGMPTGSTDGGWDAVPAQSPVLVPDIAITPGTTLTFDATGKVHFDSDVNGGNGPDGAGGGSHALGEQNGISQISSTWNSLIAVFLDDNQPSLSPAPTEMLNFLTPASRDYLTLAPKLKQVFFIGDGKTSGAVAQQITVPAGATRLFLGTMDGFGWFNNSGSFTVTINRAP